MANKKIIYGSLIVLGFLYYMNYGRRNMSAKSDNSNDLDNNLTPSLSVDDKISLFKSASNKYSGGAKPTQEILERIKKENKMAMLKIEAYMLLDEYKAWTKNKQDQRIKKPKDNFAYPLSTFRK
jgi:hypothetical protein